MPTKRTEQYEPSKTKLVDHRKVLWSNTSVPVYFEKSTWKFFALPDPSNVENILTSDTMKGLCDLIDVWDHTQTYKFVWHKEIWITFVNDYKNLRFELYVVDVGIHPIIGTEYKNMPSNCYNKTVKLPHSQTAESTLAVYLKTLNADIARIGSEESIRHAFSTVFGEKPPISKRFKHLEMD